MAISFRSRLTMSMSIQFLLGRPSFLLYAVSQFPLYSLTRYSERDRTRCKLTYFGWIVPLLFRWGYQATWRSGWRSVRCSYWRRSSSTCLYTYSSVRSRHSSNTSAVSGHQFTDSPDPCRLVISMLPTSALSRSGFSHSLTLWRTLLPYENSYKSSCAPTPG